MDDDGCLVAHGKIYEGQLDVAQNQALAGTLGARSLDAEASEQWGLDPLALVEAAGRACADVLVLGIAGDKGKPCFTVLAGSGNNAADALVMLRALVLGGHAEPDSCEVLIGRMPGGEKTPVSQATLALQKLGVSVKTWDTGKRAFLDRPKAGRHRIVIDGIAGTGLDGPLRGTAQEMAEATNALHYDPERRDGNTVVSIDIPSGAFDGWQPKMAIVHADITLAIEPQKLCTYAPGVRPHAGTVLPVRGIFPPELIDKYRDAELLTWESASARVTPVPNTAHKYGRGLVEIRAGSMGMTGAARLAAQGSQATGAGMVRLVVDSSVYAAIAPACSGIMVVPESPAAAAGAHSPDAVLLGPGWGKGEDRARILERFLPLEEKGLPLVLDADAIALAKDTVFHGNAILTPHMGEFASCLGLSKEEISAADIMQILRNFAEKKKATVLLKSHVMYVASPDGRLGVIDGMNPVLAAGGSGDVLAGFCAAIAARGFDGYTCACAAATLLVRAAKTEGIANSFVDPGELARAAAAIAGGAWVRRGQ
ncbi:MAG: NAD(P)H-hydrate dehydratase [Treponema sp.]|nr:NAD(P)H-hydrate dehydratase [Treponema sp.]